MGENPYANRRWFCIFPGIHEPDMDDLNILKLIYYADANLRDDMDCRGKNSDSLFKTSAIRIEGSTSFTVEKILESGPEW